MQAKASEVLCLGSPPKYVPETFISSAGSTPPFSLEEVRGQGPMTTFVLCSPLKRTESESESGLGGGGVEREQTKNKYSRD